MSKKQKRNKKNDALKIERRVPEDAKRFSNLNFKKFKKKNSELGKKEAKKEYYNLLEMYLPDTIKFLITIGHIRKPEIQEIKEGCINKFLDDEFIKHLRKTIKEEEIENIKLLPIVLYETILIIDRENNKRAAENNTDLLDKSEISELLKKLLKDRVKEFEKAGIDAEVAYSVLVFVPTKKSIQISRQYRIKSVINALYSLAKTKKIDFGTVISHLVKDEEIPSIITYCLLEKKEVFGNLDDAQKEFYLGITAWIFDTLEKMKIDEIENIIGWYIKSRSEDDARNIDSNRRFYLGNLSELDYPRIVKVLKRLEENNPSIKKYM
jgi:hypothetical protein